MNSEENVWMKSKISGPLRVLPLFLGTWLRNPGPGICPLEISVAFQDLCATSEKTSGIHTENYKVKTIFGLFDLYCLKSLLRLIKGLAGVQSSGLSPPVEEIG